jgi:hypothetical protein
MLKFAANLSFLYNELPFMERFAAAAKDGFKGVEYLFPYAVSAQEIEAALRDTGLQQVLFNAPPAGHDRDSAQAAWDQGVRGTTCLPGREEEFKSGFMLALEYADQGAAALGGSLAAELHGLEILESSIQDRATNTTRFLVIGEKTCPPTGNDRTSILFSIQDKPGALVSALQSFDQFEINMSKIESRPSKQKDWEYIFYVDLGGHCEDQRVKEALVELRNHCSLVKLLGSYPDCEE